MSEEQLIATPGVFGENGNFLLERELGRGGMGGVYLGRDKMLDRPVAVKVMLKEYGSDAEFVEKFKKEAQAAARLIHPNIAQIYSYGITDGMPYIAMELVAGGSLFGLMKNAGKNSDVPRMMKICEQVAQALRCAADQGLVHGDVKPENVLLDSNGNAKLVDFGLAAMAKETDEIWGTPYYIAPEKVRKQPVDYRADMYSLGGTLYHALTGVAPFEGKDATEVVKRRFDGKPKKPSEIRPDGITPQIDFLVMKMLALDPADRYPTFEALIDDFQKVMKFGLGKSQLQLDDGAEAAKPKLGIKRKKLSVNPAKRDPDAEEDDDSEAEQKPSRGGRFKVRGKKPGRVSGVSARHRLEASDDEPDDKAGKSIGIVVGAVVGAIALVVGGLVWYNIHDRNVREAERLAQIERGYNSARDAIVKLRDAAGKKIEEYDALAQNAEKECAKQSERLAEVMRTQYSEAVLAMLKSAPSQEYLDAVASTNTASEAAEFAETSEKPAKAKKEAVDPMAPAGGGSKAAIAKVVKPSAKFRDPTDDEADPMSPAHADYLADKAKWEAAQKGKAAEAEATPEAAAAAPIETVQVETAAGTTEEVPAVVVSMNELWDRAYACLAAGIRLRVQLTKVIEDADAALKGASAADETAMRDLADKSSKLKEAYETANASKDVEVLKKGRTFIEGKGKKTVEGEARRIREKLAQEQRDRNKAAEAEAERIRLERLAKEHAELVEKEIAAAKEKFKQILDNRNLQLLDWKGAKRMLNDLNRDLSTSEGEIELAKQLKKVEALEAVHQIMIRNLKNYTFATGVPPKGLKGMTVVSVDEENITYKKKDAVRSTTIQWVKFYRDYHTNLNELMNRFVRRGRENGNPKLNLMQWAEAMIGSALTLQIICSDDPTAPAFGEQLVKEMVKKFPNFLKQAQDAFPDIDFSDVAAEVDSDNL